MAGGRFHEPAGPLFHEAAPMDIYNVLNEGHRRDIRLRLQGNPYPIRAKSSRKRYYKVTISSKLKFLTVTDCMNASKWGSWFGKVKDQEGLVILISWPDAWGDMSLDDVSVRFPKVEWLRRKPPKARVVRTLSLPLGVTSEEFDWLLNGNDSLVRTPKLLVGAEAVSLWSGTGQANFDVKLVVIPRFPLPPDKRRASHDKRR